MSCLLALVLACGGGEPAPPAQAPAVQARAPEPEPERVAIRHILVSYRDAKGAPFGTRRSRRDARRKAEEILRRIEAGESFAALAESESDDPSAARGGFLGSARKGTWVPAFEKAAFALRVGEVSGIVETPFGFHILKREPLHEIHLQHIVVQYRGARATDPDGEARHRSRDKALEIARQAVQELDAGTPFDEVAARFSDGPMGKRGADLGWFQKGELGPAFDEAAFSLAPGEHSGVIESPFGFHVVRRAE